MTDFDPNTVNLRGTRALCLDDEKDMGTLLGFMLQTEGVSVTLDTDPASGVQQAQELVAQGQTIDFVTVDGRRGNGEPYGYTRECLEALGKLGLLEDAAVVLISGDANNINVPDDLLAIIDGQLAKPFGRQALASAVRVAIARKRTKIAAAQDQDR